uniref:Response regulatory domain-containing protein n=1 Tax=Chromera velia CCMP2878 TaxID=1169474 RepID=A0A0G4HY34_9ALVE|eukprot:Cvel_33373.t1-p1 / transcript=Cvel_33373.t1 / gene=Cvel_33373 / organism=Chromera_velia_CCMP2878 / gene_product=hypothetical protein / transcript_product=hypothetical protein / location=Cvel_scaffold5402:1129-1899(-) / protein_length=257 / sequence_SO=supercontig / SO=protein_coding / is_pseudo=false
MERTHVETKSPVLEKDEMRFDAESTQREKGSKGPTLQSQTDLEEEGKKEMRERTEKEGNPTASAEPNFSSSTLKTETQDVPLHPYSIVKADVLLVDDDRFCLMGGSVAIRRLGFSVQTAEDGEDACDLVISKGGRFRFVLMDKNMARMEGPDAIRKMVSHFSSLSEGPKENVVEHEHVSSDHKRGNLQPSLPLSLPLATLCPRPFFIGCTGDATPEAISVFMQAGADRVLFKPLQPSKLKEVLAELEKGNRERGEEN